MLELCSENHDEICFERDNKRTLCPICQIIKGKKAEIEKLEGEISELKDKIEDIEFELEEAKELNEGNKI